MTTATVSLPPIPAQLQAAVRALGPEIGWKRVAKLIAFGPVRETPEERQRRQQEKALAAQERAEAALYLACDNPVLNFCGYRKVMRFRQNGHRYGRKERPRPVLVEQVTVTERLAGQLRERGIKVEHDRRKGTFWADTEDEAWGSDDWMTEAFGERYGQPGYGFDDALTLLRKADEARRFLA